MRLWGATGQTALENSHILLLNSGPGVVGLETLKNLVLPGIGNFTIQDSAVVSEADLGVNFFLEEEHLGSFRAEHTCNLLKELNPDVQGTFVTEVWNVQLLAYAHKTNCYVADRIIPHTARCAEAVYPHSRRFPNPTRAPRQTLRTCRQIAYSALLHPFCGLLLAFFDTPTSCISDSGHPSQPRDHIRPAAPQAMARASAFRYGKDERTG